MRRICAEDVIQTASTAHHHIPLVPQCATKSRWFEYREYPKMADISFLRIWGLNLPISFDYFQRRSTLPPCHTFPNRTPSSLSKMALPDRFSAFGSSPLCRLVNSCYRSSFSTRIRIPILSRWLAYVHHPPLLHL